MDFLKSLTKAPGDGEYPDLNDCTELHMDGENNFESG